jgi:hypothetical protein
MYLSSTILNNLSHNIFGIWFNSKFCGFSYKTTNDWEKKIDDHTHKRNYITSMTFMPKLG